MTTARLLLCSVLSLGLGVLGATAQTVTTITVPANVTPTGSDAAPLATAPSRYQQWYSASDLGLTARVPVRIRAMAFLAAQVLQSGSDVDIEIRMAHMAPQQAPSTNFANNIATDNTLVFPRARVNLVAMPAVGTRVVTFNFATQFLWNGSSSIVVDIKVYGNGNNNQPYLYPCQTVIGAFGQTTRMSAAGNPASLTTATLLQQGQGLITVFDAVDGAVVSFGTGCPGAGNRVPVAAATGGLPIPPNPNWGFEVSNAAALANALLVIGTNNRIWGTTPLPIDLGVIGATGCFLRVDALVFFGATTSAAGIGQVSIPLPGVTLRRRQLFAQWVIPDVAAPNGILSTSQGLWVVFGD